MEVQEAIKSRRSIRKYKADPVDDRTLEMVLEAARLAPSRIVVSAGGLLWCGMPRSRVSSPIPCPS